MGQEKMRIEKPSPIVFGYKHQLKTLWLKNKMPTVTKGFYGDILTKDNVTLEHLLPHSKGGKTSLENLVLATDHNNFKRSNLPLKDFIDFDKAREYLEQFRNIRLKDFNGNEYIRAIERTIKKMVGEGK